MYNEPTVKPSHKPKEATVCYIAVYNISEYAKLMLTSLSLSRCCPGIFTAPVDGRYFFSAILTGHKNEKIEAVLSKSNYGMARVDSGGYQPEGLEAKITPGSLAVFNIILPLQAGDTVCIDLVMGKLAHSVEPLTIFSGMLLYEHM
jgi:hypothetical protein